MPALSRRWLAVAAATLSIVITASLGSWQLRRAAQKEQIAATIAARGTQAALTNAELLHEAADASSAQQLHYRHAKLKGQWLNNKTVFLDNRQMQGRPGFFVVTPLRLSGSEQALLVQRGWVPRQFNDRNALPVMVTEAGEQQLEVMIAPPPAKLFQFSADEHGKIRQNIDMNAFAAETKLKLLPLSAQQLKLHDPQLNDGLLRDWPRINAGVDKHYGYAAQWFGLAAFIAVLTLWFQVIKPRRMRVRAGVRND